jgi:hypothetical protein
MRQIAHIEHAFRIGETLVITSGPNYKSLEERLSTRKIHICPIEKRFIWQFRRQRTYLPTFCPALSRYAENNVFIFV